MKIGLFLGYGPQVTLGKEGLGRYIGGLLKGFQSQGHDVTIACPHWMIETLEDLAKDFFIDTSKLRWVTAKEDPPLWKIYLWLNREKKKHHWNKFVKKAKQLCGRVIQSIAKTHNIFAFIGWILLLIVPGLVMLLPTTVIYLLWKIIHLIMKIIKKVKGKIKILFDNGMTHILGKGDYQLHLFIDMTDGEINRLIRKINKGKAQDVWFVPSIFWPQVNKIYNGTVVINAPDLLTQEFPQGFAEVYNAENSVEKCRQTLENGNFFITYSEFLRQTLLLEQYGKHAKRTKAISHINNTMNQYLLLDPTLKKQNNFETEPEKIFAQFLTADAMNIYSEKISYIFYSSQIRYSKNMLNLVKAYEYLLREKFVHFKLLLTANFNHNPEFKQYIQEHRLENEVISCYNVPARTLAAIYRCADLVVNPTLYEGGFPFTFGEGMSVGTPSIMSDIPQVRDVLEPAGLEEIMFDPYDWKAIANKILWGLDHRDELYQKELPLYREMEKRTPEVVAAEYVEAFEEFIAQDRDQQAVKAV